MADSTTEVLYCLFNFSDGLFDGQHLLLRQKDPFQCPADLVVITLAQQTKLQ
jgi:hypothetical protein